MLVVGDFNIPALDWTDSPPVNIGGNATGRDNFFDFKPESQICGPPQDFNATGESTRTTRFHFKTKEFILTLFSTLAILPH